MKYPTDAKLLNGVHKRLVKKARATGLYLRKNYVREEQMGLLQVNRSLHAHQIKRMKREVKILRTNLGRVVPDIQHMAKQIEDPCVQQLLVESYLELDLALTKQVMVQEKTSKNKMNKRYEFRVKMGVAVTNRSNFVAGGLAFSGNLYYGHTLQIQLGQNELTTRTKPEEELVESGYRGHSMTDSQGFISGQKRGVYARLLKCMLKRRKEVEPVVEDIKHDGLLGYNYLKSIEGDQKNTILSCVGHNTQIILKETKICCANFWRRLFSRLGLDISMTLLAFWFGRTHV